jgi:protein-ribulosamine 3-kinase
MMNTISPILSDIERVTESDLSQADLIPVGGGCINTAYQVQTDTQSYFLKVNSPALSDMFEAEAKGLSEMQALNSVRIPEVITYGQTEQHSYIALEYIHLTGLRGQSQGLLGNQLAELHRHEHDFFGWHTNNTIGSTPQYNERQHDWPTFWQQQRLAPQFKLAYKNGFGGSLQSKGEQLMSNLHHFFEGYTPIPSLLHGDLWGGNAAADENGAPVIFDPACYYGDRETDIAMTELFGGFGNDFFNAYHAEFPLDPAYKTRKTLYNLYHILNHVNLFGGGYAGQAENMINQLLAEIK